MTFITGTSLIPLLEQLPALAQPSVFAVSGQGIVLFLQAVAYVLVSLAAVAVLLRVGLKSGASQHKHGGCKCAGRDESGSHDGATDAHSTCCNGSGHGAGHHHHHGEAVSLRLHTNGNACAQAKSAQAHGVGAEAKADGHQHEEVPANGEPRSLAHGRLPGRCTLPAASSAPEADSAAARIRAAVTDNSASVSGASSSTASSATDADEQRRITAVIAAAVHNVLGGQPHRIVRIEPVSQSWAQEGRRDIFSSHRIR